MLRRASGGSSYAAPISSLGRFLPIVFGLGVLPLIAALSIAAPPGRGADPFVQADAANEEEPRAVDGVFLPPDRTTRNRLESAEKMLGEGRYGESVRYLGSLLDAPEDFFFKLSGNQSLFRSLKSEAGRLLAEMPAEGRQSYELQFGASARKLLEGALSSGDIGTIAEVSRRFFYTEAGAEATLLLARRHLDHGQWLAAAQLFERLHENKLGAQRLEPTLSLLLANSWHRAGHSDKAQSVLLRLKRSGGVDHVLIAGKPIKLFDADSDALQWLVDHFGKSSGSASSSVRQWSMHRGNPARNADSTGGMPLLNLRWRQQTINDTKLEEMASKLREGYQEQDIAVLPSMQPLAIGDVVLMRTTQRLQAIDFLTGKRIWRYPVDEPATDEPPATSHFNPFGQPQTLLSRLDGRLWDDTTFGTLSSDGELVYCLEDLELTPPSPAMQQVLRNNNARFPTQLIVRNTNRLAALELATEGKLQWRVGGPTGEDEPKLAGVFFLGPPLPLHGRLYALAETRGQEIRLVVLSAKTGRMEWSQQLAFVEDDIFDDDSRRTAGLTPSFADGVLVCPTASGAVVAVDVDNRSLLWGYQYPRAEGDEERLQRRGGMFQFNATAGNTGPRASDQWMDSTAILADGRVLVTPPESDDLYCLNLIDGKLQWRQKRGANLYIGGVDDGKVLLIGHHQLNLVKLADGKPAWKQPLMLPAGAIPSGRGYLSDGRYFLPLSTAEVAQVNLATGEIEQRAKARRGNAPGNLIAYRGHVISQNSDYLEVFSQLDVLRTEVAEALAKSPDDPKALARQGELKLHDGQLNEALALLRTSYQAESSVSTRDLLVESLLSALQSDFSGNRQAAAELESLIDQKHQRLAYLRLMCTGLQAAGEIEGALDVCLKVIDEEAEPLSLDEVDPELSVRRDRWIQARISQLYAAAGAPTKVRIDRLAGERLEKAGKAQSAEALRRFVASFGGLPMAEQAREQLVVRLLAGDPSLECEMLLRRLEMSTDAQRSRAATARLAELLKEGKHPALAATAYRKLAGEYGDRVCLNEKTGKQIFDELPKDSTIRELVAGSHEWPAGQVKDKTNSAQKRSAARPPQPPLDLDIRGGGGPFFDDMSVSFELQSQSVIAQDSLGRERFRLPISGGQQSRSQNAFAYTQFSQANLTHATAQGSMLAVYLGHQIVAFDTQYNRELPNGLMWTQDLTEQLRSFAAGQGYRAKEVRAPWGGTITVPIDTSARPLGMMGPLNQESLCFQRFRELVCVDPLTGKVLWTRKNVAPGSWLYGDDEIVAVAPPDGNEAMILSAVDGQLLARRTIPSVEQRMTGVGRSLLAWHTETGEPTLALTDLLTGDNRWTLVAEPGVKAALISVDEVAVFVPRTGSFKVLRIADGQTLVDLQLQPERNLASIHVTRSQNQYLLITDSLLERPDPEVRVQPFPQGVSKNRVVSGRMYAIDRATGKPQWPQPLEIKQQGIVSGQPIEAPLFVFARHLQRPTPNSPPQSKTSILCVDKRSGRTIEQDVQLNGNGNNLEVQADPSNNTVSLVFPGHTVMFELTNDQWPSVAEKDKKSVPEVLLKAVEDTVKKLVPQALPDNEFQDDD